MTSTNDTVITERYPKLAAPGASRYHFGARPAACLPPYEPAGGGSTGDALLALASLSRALDGSASLADVGALMWMLVQQLVPADAFVLFLPDERNEHVAIRYAAGVHAAEMHGLTRPAATGIAGQVAVHRRSVLNGDPMLDLGLRAAAAPALRSCVVTPLVESDAVVAILALYSKTAKGFTVDHARVLEILSPRLASALVDAAIADEDTRLRVADVPRRPRLVHSS